MRASVGGLFKGSPGEGENSTRRLLLAGLAIVTPAGLVVVNVAAYVMANLAAFRVAITVSAVVSTIVLNGLAAAAGFRLCADRWPNAWIFAERDRRAQAVVAGFALVMAAALAGVLTYRGLSDPRRLPNLQTFIAGLIGLAIPILLATLFRRDASRRVRRRFRTR